MPQIRPFTAVQTRDDGNDTFAFKAASISQSLKNEKPMLLAMSSAVPQARPFTAGQMATARRVHIFDACCCPRQATTSQSTPFQKSCRTANDTNEAVRCAPVTAARFDVMAVPKPAMGAEISCSLSLAQPHLMLLNIFSDSFSQETVFIETISSFQQRFR